MKGANTYVQSRIFDMAGEQAIAVALRKKIAKIKTLQFFCYSWRVYKRIEKSLFN